MKGRGGGERDGVGGRSRGCPLPFKGCRREPLVSCPPAVTAVPYSSGPGLRESPPSRGRGTCRGHGGESGFWGGLVVTERANSARDVTRLPLAPGFLRSLVVHRRGLFAGPLL